MKKKNNQPVGQHFFDPGDTLIIRGDESFRINTIKNKSLNCDDCGLSHSCKTPYMKISGQGRKKILFVGEAPGRVEDQTGQPFTGSSGIEIRTAIEKVGLIPERDVFFVYANRCRPLKNKKPTDTQVEACRKFLQEDIEKYKPNIIVPVGENAFDVLVGRNLTGRANRAPYSSWVSENIPDQKTKTWICPIYHPEYLAFLLEKNQNPSKSAPMKIWMDSLKRIVSLVDTPVPDTMKHTEKLEIITTPDSVISYLDNLTNEVVSFDYETTGLKPHRKGHEIICASVYDGVKAISFPFFKDKAFRESWKRFLVNPNIKRVAHNISFESIWSYGMVDVWPHSWHGDSMLAAHCLNNKKNVGLKFLVYSKLGVLSYDDKADAFISSSEKEKSKWGDNGFNHMKDMPLMDMLHYCGLDSIFGRMIWEEMTSQLKPFQMVGLNLLIEGQFTLAKIQENGMFVSTKELRSSEAMITEKIKEASKWIYRCSELKKWDLAVEFNPNSPIHLKRLLYDRLGFEPPFYTDKNNPSTDEKALNELKLPITDAILEYRRWDKALNTYLHQFAIEVIDEVVHSFFSTGTVKSFRSSSFAPPMQNVPTRDAEVKKAVRSILVPAEGNKLKGYDYKSIEVMVAALYTQDKNLLTYVRDLSTDMHRDLAMQLFKVKKDDVKKMWRYWAKNRFVFPEFYGSYYKNCAPDLWKDILSDPELHNHMRDKGISTYQRFEQHVMEVEDDFWNVRFYEYALWKKEQIAKLNKNGYVDSLTGFRYWAPMSEREACNYPVQGSAFHILLWSQTQIQKELEERGIIRSVLCSEIHDQILTDVHPDDEKIMDYLVWKWGTQKVREHWKWITVPLLLEQEAAEIDESWSSMTEKGFLVNPFDKKTV